MATVNPYFQSGRSIGRPSEQNLYEDLIIESMKIYGMEVFYLPRSPSNVDEILTEDPLNSYNHAYPIEMYMETLDGFEGDDEIISKFGLEIRNSTRFVVARKRWREIVGSTNTTVLDRPCEGDIVYFPMTKSLFEIKKVEGQQPFYQAGKLYVYKLQCELLQLSNERFNTGIEEIDNLAAKYDMNLLNFASEAPDGVQLAFEGSGDPIVAEGADFQNEIGADNTKFDKDILNVLDFSEKNPFGEVFNK
jgi:hypothetical protein